VLNFDRLMLNLLSNGKTIITVKIQKFLFQTIGSSPLTTSSCRVVSQTSFLNCVYAMEANNFINITSSWFTHPRNEPTHQNPLSLKICHTWSISTVSSLEVEEVHYQTIQTHRHLHQKSRSPFQDPPSRVYLRNRRSIWASRPSSASTTTEVICPLQSVSTAPPAK
jgi:hypothetical protein